MEFKPKVVATRQLHGLAEWSSACGLRTLGLLLALLGTNSCASLTSPDQTRDTPDVMVVAGEPPTIATISLAHTSTTRIPLSGVADVAALSAGGDALLIASPGGGDLAAVSVTTGQTLWAERLSTTLEPRLDRWNGVVIGGQAGLAETTDGTALFTGPAFADSVNGTEGVAVLDSRTRDLRGFIAPFFLEARGLTSVPATNGTPAAMVIVGRRARYPSVIDDWVYVVDARTLAIVDSTHADLAAGVPSPAPLFMPQYSSASSAIYVFREGPVRCLVEVGWPSLTVGSSVCNPALRLFTVGPDGSVVAMLSNPDWTTEIVEYDGQLHERRRLSFGVNPETGLPAQGAGLAISPTGATLYVVTGTGSIVLDQPGPQPGQLHVIDMASWQITRVLSLGVFLPQQVFAVGPP